MAGKMHESDFLQDIHKLIEKDDRYHLDAYIFVREGLDFTVKMMSKPHRGPSRHISGVELLEGLRRYAIGEFGPMALTVLKTWGITGTEDFGAIVFSLVAIGKLGKNDTDKEEDFVDGYDFAEAFSKPFLPKSAQRSTGDNTRSAGKR